MIGGFLSMVGGSEFEEISSLFSGVFGFFMAFVLAFFYAVMGSIMAAILAWLYNFFARLVGGVEITLEPEPGPSMPPEAKITPPPPSTPSEISTG
jgi:hypothetical protein